MESVFFSRVSYNIGQRLTKRIGRYAAARWMQKNGFSINDAVEYLATVPQFVALSRQHWEHRKTDGKCISTEAIDFVPSKSITPKLSDVIRTTCLLLW